MTFSMTAPTVPTSTSTSETIVVPSSARLRLIGLRSLDESTTLGKGRSIWLGAHAPMVHDGGTVPDRAVARVAGALAAARTARRFMGKKSRCARVTDGACMMM